MQSSSKDKGVLVELRVVAGARESKIVRTGGLLKAWVRAKPVGGKANRELESLFSRIDPQARITSGFKSRRKRILLPGISLDELESKISELGE